MKKIFLTIFILSLFVFLNVFSQSNADDLKLYRIDNPAKEDILSIREINGDINRYIPNQLLEVYLNQYQYQELRDKKLNIYLTQNLAKIYADSLRDATKNSKNPMLSYHTYQEITDTLNIWAQQFSDIAELHSIGQTVQGREMWILKISDNVTFEEAEPEFKYISTMHGDEVVGKELLFELIRLLLFEYGTNSRITNLVDNTEIWIMPNMNFDGTAGNTPYSPRYNANGVNLNRNFPDREYGNPPFPGHPYPIQPETQNVINFMAQHNFVLSANFHGGALVANYPWDKRLPGDGGVAPYAGAPDDRTFIDLALTYSINNPPMYNSPHFNYGITNGAVWYEIDGGMQDWNYFEFDCKELTLEISNSKWPPASQLPQFWLENKESLLSYMEKVHTGIKGVVTDHITGLPIQANVTVIETGSGVETDPDFGDYYKVISPGNYSLFFTAPGYRDTIVTNVSVDSIVATAVNVELSPDIIFDLNISVVDKNTFVPLNDVRILLFNKDGLVKNDSTDINGLMQSSVLADSFSIKAIKDLYFDVDTTISVFSDTSITLQMHKYIPSILKGNIITSAGGNVSGSVIYCQGKTDTLDNSGDFRLTNLKPGTLSAFVSLQNHRTSRIDTSVNNGDSLDLQITLYIGDNNFFDDFESHANVAYFSSGDWEKGIHSYGPSVAYSGVKLWGTQLNSSYSNNSLYSKLETGEITIFGINDPVLKFYQWYDIEDGTDGGNIKVSVDNGLTWEIIFPTDGYPLALLPSGGGNPLEGEPGFSGSQQFWKSVTCLLDNFSFYPSIKIRFDFGVDQSGNAAGWYIDDLQIYDGIVVAAEFENSIDSQLQTTITNFPNPFNPETNIKLSLLQKSFVNLQILDIKGALVKTIISRNYRSGDYIFKWDGTNNTGIRVSSGLYFISLKTKKSMLNKKILLIR